MRHGDGVFITVGNVCASERKARGVEMIETLRKAFLGTDRKGEFAQQQVTAVAGDLIKAAAEFKAVEQVGTDTRTKQQIEGFVGKKLRGQRQGAIGKPSAIDDHPCYGFASGDLFLVMGRHARINQCNDASIFDNRSHHAEMVQAFNADRFHWQPSRLHGVVSTRCSGEGISLQRHLS